MQKIKEKLHLGRDSKNSDAVYDNTSGYNGTATYGATGNLAVESTRTSTTSSSSSGMEKRSLGGFSNAGEQVVERPVAVGVAEVPVVVTEQERIHTEQHVAQRTDVEVCGTKTFTEVEDRPIIRERVERILEHQPVEKQYVVETRYVGERPIPSATGPTIIDTTERVVERAEPGPKCPVGTGQILDQTIENFQRRI